MKPNAIAAVGPRPFYFVNVRKPPASTRCRSLLLRRTAASLVYHDGTRGALHGQDLRSSGGLALSPDQTRLYVAETPGNRCEFTGGPRQRRSPARRIVRPASPRGSSTSTRMASVWIAAHPKLHASPCHAHIPASVGRRRYCASIHMARNPSQARTIAPAAVYANDGGLFPRAPSPRAGATGSSSAHCSTTRCSFANRTREPDRSRARPASRCAARQRRDQRRRRSFVCSPCRQRQRRHASPRPGCWSVFAGVWAGVLGANSPFLHGLVAGVPALVLGLMIPARCRRSSSRCWICAVGRADRRGA